MAEHGSQNDHNMGVLFIDNSNIYIEGKKLYARQLHLKTHEDPCFRIDVGKLCNVLLGTRNKAYGKLYGSEPPAVDSVWKQIRDAGLEVDTYKRNEKGKEKEVDTTLVADAIEYAYDHENEISNTTIIILAGDRDYNPLVQKLLKRKWSVEVASFSNALAGTLRNIEKENNGLKIIEIDKLPLRSFSFVDRKWNARSADDSHRQIPAHLTVAFSFKKEFSVNDKTYLARLTNELTRIIKLPCRYYCHQENKPRSRTVLIIFDRITSQYFRYEEIKTHWTEIDQACNEIFARFQFEKYESAVHYLQEKRQANDASHVPVGILRWLSTDENNEAEIAEDEDEEFDYEGTEDQQADAASSSGQLEDNLGFQESNSSIPESEESSESEGGEFRVVERSQTRIRVTSSQPCKFGFNCRYLTRCNKRHTEEQREYFRFSQENKLKIGNKCKRLPCHGKFKLSNCRTGNSRISHRCYFYHSLEEARCYVCRKIVGEIGHHESQECRDKMV